MQISVFRAFDWPSCACGWQFLAKIGQLINRSHWRVN